MISSISSQLLSGLGVRAAVSGERTAIAVPPANVIYAHFEHVSGVPAPDGVTGVSVSKLKILDSMIERLKQLRSSRLEESNPVPGGSDNSIDRLIEQLKQQLDAQNKAREAMPYAPDTAFRAGSFFSITV